MALTEHEQSEFVRRLVAAEAHQEQLERGMAAVEDALGKMELHLQALMSTVIQALADRDHG